MSAELDLAYHHGNLREAVLERAAQVVAEHGVEALSLRSLARDLGVSHSAPSRHFPDRAALLSALAKSGFERSVEAMLDGAEAAGKNPIVRYRALGRSYVRFAVEHPALFRAMNHPEVRAQMDNDTRAASQVFFRTLREGVEEAQKAGWHPEADPEALVAFSIGGAMGAADLLSDDQSRNDLGVVDPGKRERLADAVLDLIVQPGDAAPSAADESLDPRTLDSKTLDSKTRRAR